ncbi:ribosomal protein L14-domain-containing protein [Ampelomyces quisqualis]|uniref:Ribosomal protein L14-domain-containing protein n=1 Tax=Ampelomyces quisqualis TaxID=50730 RepID=A0A6A5QNG1_AMPQU|nr:ribosomal protein L14-domain-containing protein [Ampelomyces quisqualis]
MDLTPVKIRGRKRRHPASVLTEKIQSVSQVFTPEANTSCQKKYKKRKDTVPAMPTLQGLPQELLEIIFLDSMNIALPQSSPALGRRLSSHAITMDFTMRSFFHTVDHKTNHRDRVKTSDPTLQSELLACRFFTWDFFRKYVERAHDAMIKLRGKAWEKTGVEVPGVREFDGLWPFRFTNITYLSFAEGFHIPEKLLHGPWTKDKASLLYVLVSLNGEIDWSGSLSGETAKSGIRQAIKESNEHAVAALAVLLGVPKAITTDMLRCAVIDYGCSINILRHLLFNAQVLAWDTSRDLLDFHDPGLWAWAESHSEKGAILKNMLRKADAFDLEFFFESEDTWREIVPFPYGGSKFDARTAFDNAMVKELLGAHTDEMGDANITTSAWRLVEVGRVVLFNEGQYEGRLATVVEIIDHKRVLVDGPSEKAFVPRQEVALAKLSLTPIVIPKLPRASGVGHVAKKWEEHKVQQKFDESTWAKKRAAMQKRRGLNDFERFKVLKMRKQARYEVQKTFAKIRASAKA